MDFNFNFNSSEELSDEDLETATKELFKIFSSLKSAGFTDDQAMTLITSILKEE